MAAWRVRGLSRSLKGIYRGSIRVPLKGFRRVLIRAADCLLRVHAPIASVFKGPSRVPQGLRDI